MATATKAKAVASKAGSAKKAVAKPAAPAKKAPAKPVKKAAPAPKAVAKPAVDTVKPIKDTFTRTALVAHIAQTTGVESKSVKAVLAALEGAIQGSIMKKGAGEFMLSGMFKVTVQDIPARKARKGIDPFTKEERMFAAKPASRRVKIRALKKLKDSAA
jgi:nucleoid DNA-binding protein